MWKQNYLPFGKQRVGIPNNTSTNATRNQAFGGKSYDGLTGLSYFGARYFDPVIGRFMAVDPVGPDPEGNIHSLNRYTYANNNPYKYVDPDGRAAVPSQDPQGTYNLNSGVDSVNIGGHELTAPGAYFGVAGVVFSAELAIEAGVSATLARAGVWASGAFKGVKGASEVVGDIKYHYTTAAEASFKDGLWKDSSVTDVLYKSAIEAGQKLGIPTPNKVISIKDNGNFVPNKPSTVQRSNRYQGGGNDFVNPRRVPSGDILPAQAIGGN